MSDPAIATVASILQATLQLHFWFTWPCRVGLLKPCCSGRWLLAVQYRGPPQRQEGSFRMNGIPFSSPFLHRNFPPGLHMSPHLPGQLRRPCQVGGHVRHERRDRSRVASSHLFCMVASRGQASPGLALSRVFPFCSHFAPVMPWGLCTFDTWLWVRP